MPAKSVLLAPNQLPDPATLTYPLLASVKLDGRRCLLQNGKFLSRTMKAQPNVNLYGHLAEIAAYSKSHGIAFDGELYSHELTFSELESVFKSGTAPIPPSVKFHVFDIVPNAAQKNMGFRDRLAMLEDLVMLKCWPNVWFVHHDQYCNAKQVQAMYEDALSEGYEGLMLRDPKGLYKHGRATLREGIIFKMKPFITLDAKVIGFEQGQRLKAGIERKTNELGRTAKTYKAEDHEPDDTMGALRVRDEQGREFSLGWGRGWTHAKRKELWNNRSSLLGEWVEFRCMGVGEKDLPRMPQLIRFRDRKD